MNRYQNSFKKIKKYFEKKNIDRNKINITLAGVAFKGRPETDDLRGTMAKPIFDEIKKNFPRSKIQIFDPIVKIKDIKKNFNSSVSSSLESSFKNTSLYIIANNHPLFNLMPISNFQV